MNDISQDPQSVSDRPGQALNAVMNSQPQPPIVQSLPPDGSAGQPAMPMPVGPSHKEQQPLKVEISGEMPSGMQSVEELRTPEIPVEVESFLQEVKSEEPSQLPSEVVIAGDNIQLSPQAVLPQTKIILPMTQAQYQQGKKANPNTSFRWLAEWTEKIKAMFPNLAIWRPAN